MDEAAPKVTDTHRARTGLFFAVSCYVDNLSGLKFIGKSVGIRTGQMISTDRSRRAERYREMDPVPILHFLGLKIRDVRDAPYFVSHGRSFSG